MLRLVGKMLSSQQDMIMIKIRVKLRLMHNKFRQQIAFQILYKDPDEVDNWPMYKFQHDERTRWV